MRMTMTTPIPRPKRTTPTLWTPANTTPTTTTAKTTLMIMTTTATRPADYEDDDTYEKDGDRRADNQSSSPQPQPT
jgi:hypothetical protein